MRGHDDDHDLIRQCLDGQPHAFGTLVDRYQTVLYNLALRMVKNVHDAEDIVQTVFVRAYEKLDRYDPSHKFFSWIYRMTVNESLNLLKRRRSHTTLELNHPAPDPSPAERHDRHDVSERVGLALMDLTPEDRAILILKHIQGFSYDEIAYVFEIPEKTVKSRLYTARQRLKDVLLKKRLVDHDR